MSVAPVRVKVAHALASASLTATFDEATPLDSTHLLVAVVKIGTTLAAPPIPSGWTALAGGGASGTANLRTYVIQGDGTVNSFTSSGNGTNDKHITLLAFSGFTSITPLVSNGLASSTLTTTMTPSSTPAGYGVVLASASTQNTTTVWTNNWTNGFTPVPSTPPATNHLTWSAYKEYTDDPGDTYATSVTHTQTIGRWMISILPLLPPPPPATVSYALGSIPSTLALGSTPVEAWKGAGAP